MGSESSKHSFARHALNCEVRRSRVTIRRDVNREKILRIQFPTGEPSSSDGEAPRAMYLRKLAVGEVLEEGALPDRAVADQYQSELVVENRLYHLDGARAERYTPPSRTSIIGRARESN